MPSLLTCDSCGWLVQGTTGGRCSDCRDEDAALAALYNAADHMKALIEENREMKRAKASEEAGYRRWLGSQQLPHPQPSVAGARDGWSCARCGSFVPNGNVHHCPTTAIGTLR